MPSPSSGSGYGWDWGGLVKPKGNLAEWKGLYAHPGFWIWLGVMVLCQAGLLAVPVRLERRRPVARRSVWATVAASGLMLGVLFGSFLLVFMALLFGDDGKKGLWRTPPGGAGLWQAGFLWSVLGVTLAVWALWSCVFWRASRSAEPKGLVAAIRRYLLAGSVMELLVAVPCHIAVRRREECCADLGTFWGIAMGVSVMLMSFGPGVLFLYAERWRRLTAARPDGRPIQRPVSPAP